MKSEPQFVDLQFIEPAPPSVNYEFDFPSVKEVAKDNIQSLGTCVIAEGEINTEAEDSKLENEVEGCRQSEASETPTRAEKHQKRAATEGTSTLSPIEINKRNRGEKLPIYSPSDHVTIKSKSKARIPAKSRANKTSRKISTSLEKTGQPVSQEKTHKHDASSQNARKRSEVLRSSSNQTPSKD